MNSINTLKMQIMESYAKARSPHYLPQLLQQGPLHFSGSVLRPEFTRTNNIYLSSNASKRLNYFQDLDLEKKEWEVRYGKERDGPLDVLEVEALLKMCKKESTLIKNLNSQIEFSPYEFENFMFQKKRIMIKNSSKIGISEIFSKNSQQYEINMPRQQCDTYDREGGKKTMKLELDAHNLDNLNKYQNARNNYYENFNEKKAIKNLKVKKTFKTQKTINIDSPLLTASTINNEHLLQKQTSNNTYKHNKQIQQSKTEDTFFKNYIKTDSGVHSHNLNNDKSPISISESSNTNLNNNKAVKNVYANNHINVSRTQAYSWSINKQEVSYTDQQKSTRFIEKVIGKDEIRKIRKMNTDITLRTHLYDQKEINLREINNKSNLKDTLSNFGSKNLESSKIESQISQQKKLPKVDIQMNRYKNIINTKNKNLP